MTELMKRYEAETGHNAFLTYGITQAICYPTYVEWLEEQLSNQTVEKFQEIIRNQCDEISGLKEQLRWRPVSEKPEKDGWYLASVANYRAFVMLYEKGKWFEYREDYGSYMPTIPPTHWLPIPQHQKEK